MKYKSTLFIVFFMISCGEHHPANNANIIQSNPYLIGKWTGEGRFLDKDLYEEIGKILVELEITADNKIVASIGEAKLTNASIYEANYGFEVKGKLDRKVTNSTDLDKDCAILLLVLPDENRETATISAANFHLKSNFTFDFGMRVVGVQLNKGK